VSGSDDKYFKLWDSEQLTQIYEYKNEYSVLSARFHPDGTSIAIGLENGPVSVWDVRSKSLRQKLVVNVGKPIIISRKNTVENTTRVFRDKILELFNSISPE
jgi:WD40 repeat protein